MVTLRPYQIKVKSKIYESWQAGNRNVLAVAPTGAGKTEIKGSIFADNAAKPSIAIAHRQELVEQISSALAKHGVYHRIIAPQNLINFCISQHIKKFGRSYWNQNALAGVAGVDTLIRRQDELLQWRNSIQIWDIDEAHHVLRANKWGTAVNMFPNAWGLGFTATPGRCDKKGLGRHAQGVFDDMVLGPAMRDLIAQGYLAEFKCYGPPVSIDTSNLPTAADGDYSQPAVRKASHESTITGDIVDHYLKLTPGKRGITFVVDVETANEVVLAFHHKGVPALAVSAKTPDANRVESIDRFRRGEVKQLVNVDLFGEGMDVPGVEVVSAGRPTQSYPVYSQQFGRMMRISEGKTHGVYIDHVGNIKRFNGPPDRPRDWTLDDGGGTRKKSDIGEIPVTVCEGCYRDYSGLLKQCPYCGLERVPSRRDAPEFIDGDLTEYSAELMTRLFGAANATMELFDGVPATPGQAVMKKNMVFRHDAQVSLRESIALWAGIGREVEGLSDSQMYRKFYHQFGIDVLSAMALGRPEAERLTTLIRSTYT